MRQYREGQELNLIEKNNDLVYSQRKVYLDVIKVLAMFFVIYSHSQIYTLYYTSSKILETWIYMMLAMISKTGVPLFFMVSGVLLLGKNEAYSKIMKRVIRFVFIIVIFESISWYVTQRSFSLSSVVFNILADSVDWNSWYLWAYLGFLVCLPLLRKMMRCFDKHDFIYIIILHFVFASLLPIVNFIIKNHGGGVYLLCREEYTNEILLSNSFQIPLMTVKAIFYPIVGFYLDRSLNVDHVKCKKILIIMSFVLIINGGCTYYEGVNLEFSQNYIEMFDYVSAIGIFLLMKKLYGGEKYKKYKRFSYVISQLGSLTLGMYFFDIILRPLLYSSLQDFTGILEPKFSLIWCIFNMFIGSICTFI